MNDVRAYDTSFCRFFEQDEDNDLAFCPEVYDLMQFYEIQYNSNDWILFIDSFVLSMYSHFVSILIS